MNAINLKKVITGERINLSKMIPSLRNVEVRLSWKATAGMDEPIDLDLSCVVVNEGEPVKVVPLNDIKISSESELLFYNTEPMSICNGAIKHSGDILAPTADGAVEGIKIDLNNIPKNEIVLFTTIHDMATPKSKNFGQAKDAMVEIINIDTNETIIQYDLTEDYSTSISMKLCKFYKKDGDWRFNAMGLASTDNLGAILSSYGI